MEKSLKQKKAEKKEEKSRKKADAKMEEKSGEEGSEEEGSEEEGSEEEGSEEEGSEEEGSEEEGSEEESEEEKRSEEKKKKTEKKEQKTPLNRVHPMILRDGTPMFCTRNTKEGLVNGTHVVYKGETKGKRGGKLIMVQELDAKKEGKNYLIPRYSREFPFDWGFSMTTHKAQGRTFNKVCVVFLDKDEPFVHGQLMVALTRVRSVADLRIVKRSNKITNVINESIKKTADEIKLSAVNKFHK